MIRQLLFLVCALMVSVLSCQAEFVLKPNDRVVFYGDSITEQRQYTRYIQQYLFVRYPDYNLTFLNAGWGGDTAAGALNRLERDVLVHKPTVVTLCFGMNDGGYQTVNAPVVTNYRNNLDALIKAIKDKGIRVVVFSPGCVDPDRLARLGQVNYNQMLEALAKEAETLAKKHGCTFQDIFHPMLEFQKAQKAKDKNYTMIPDAVHPDAKGQMIMAYHMLKGMGAEPMPDLGSIAMSEGKTSDIKIENAPVPFWFDRGNYDTMVDSKFLSELAGQNLVIKGLPSGTYQVQINGKVAGKFTANELAAGARVAGVYSDDGQKIHQLCERKENNYFSAWREVRLPLGSLTGIDKAVEGLMMADAGFHEAIRSLAAKKSGISVTVTPAPAGPNLALRKKYVSSDPNRYNYGVGALTDGSTEPNNTFATGDAAAFPKEVTIDLEKSSRVGLVEVSVPSFGSTKTIKVAVSDDGQKFEEVGSHIFPRAKAGKFTYSFPARPVRFVKLVYPDFYSEQNGFNPNFSFTSEVEVYAPAD